MRHEIPPATPIKETAGMRYWRELTAKMISRGKSEPALEDARFYRLMGLSVDAAAATMAIEDARARADALDAAHEAARKADEVADKAFAARFTIVDEEPPVDLYAEHSTLNHAQQGTGR